MDYRLRDAIQIVYHDPNSKKILRKWIIKYDSFARKYGIPDSFEAMEKVKGRLYYGNFCYEDENHFRKIFDSEELTIRQLMFIVYVSMETFRDFFIMRLLTQSSSDLTHEIKVNKDLIYEKFKRVLKQFGINSQSNEDMHQLYSNLFNNIHKDHRSRRAVLHVLTQPTTYDLIIDNWRDNKTRIRRENHNIDYNEMYPHISNLIESLTYDEKMLFAKNNVDVENMEFIPYETGSYMYRVGKLDDERSILSEMFPNKELYTSISGSTILLLETAKIFKIDTKYIFMLLVPFLYIPKDHSLFEILFVAKNYFNDHLLMYDDSENNINPKQETNESLAYANFVMNVLQKESMDVNTSFMNSKVNSDSPVAATNKKSKSPLYNENAYTEGGLYQTMYAPSSIASYRSRMKRQTTHKISKQNIIDGLNLKCLMFSNDYFEKRIREFQW